MNVAGKSPVRILALVSLGLLNLEGRMIRAEDVTTEAVHLQITDGILFIPEGFQVRESRFDLTLHLHGAASTVEASFIQAKTPGVLLNVTLPGLSSVYQSKFRDAEVWPRILQEVIEGVEGATGSQGVELNSITVTSFSAGFGGVRELLKNGKAFRSIDRLIMADSIYSGFEGDPQKRSPNRDNMRDFLRFAKQASTGRKVFLVTHTDLHTPAYAGTSETADYLIRQLGGQREPFEAVFHETLQAKTRYRQQGFEVIGFSGRTAEDHMRHLRHMHLWLERLENLAADDQP